MFIIQIGDLNIDNIVSDVKPTSEKKGYQETESLSGRVWINWKTIKKSWSLTFDSLTKSQRDQLYNFYTLTNTFTFVDENGISIPNCFVVGQNFDDNLSWDRNGILYYSITLQIKQLS